MHIVFQVWKGLFLVAGAPHATLPAARLWSCEIKGWVPFSTTSTADHGEQGLLQLSCVVLWVTCWQQPAPEKAVFDVYSSCRKGKIRTLRGPKHLIQKEDYLCFGLPFPSGSFIELLLKYIIFLKWQWQFCLHFQMATAGLPCSWHLKHDFCGT